MPWYCEAISSSTVAPSIDGANRISVRRSTGSPSAISQNITRCKARKAKYAPTITTGPGRPPGRSWNASGIARAIMNIAAIASSRTPRTDPSSALTRLHNQEKPIQLHHSNPVSRTPRSTPCQLRSCAISAVICVSANTNTRSKNNSSVVTDWSSLVSAALMGFLDVMRHILPPEQAADWKEC
jgi:hypothetical protein